MRKLLKRRSGEGYIDVCVLVVCAMLNCSRWWFVIAPGLHQQTAAGHLCGGAGARGAEIAGRVGTETTRRAAALTDSTGLDPTFGGPLPDASSSMTRVTCDADAGNGYRPVRRFGSFPIRADGFRHGASRRCIGSEETDFSPSLRRGQPMVPCHLCWYC